jgi:hypothetical protein
MSRAIDAFRDALDHEYQLKQGSRDENPDKEGYDSCHQIDYSVRRRLLIAEHNLSHNRDSTEDNGEHIQQLYKTAKQGMIEPKIEKSRKEILFFGHAASWAHESMAIAGYYS